MEYEEIAPDIALEIPKELQDLWDRMDAAAAEIFPEINFDVPEMDYELPDIPTVEAEYADMEGVMDAYIAGLAGSR